MVAVEAVLEAGFQRGKLRSGLEWLGYPQELAERVIAGLQLTGLLNAEHTALLFLGGAIVRRSKHAQWFSRLRPIDRAE